MTGGSEIISIVAINGGGEYGRIGEMNEMCSCASNLPAPVRSELPIRKHWFARQ